MCKVSLPLVAELPAARLVRSPVYRQQPLQLLPPLQPLQPSRNPKFMPRCWPDWTAGICGKSQEAAIRLNPTLQHPHRPRFGGVFHAISREPSGRRASGLATIPQLPRVPRPLRRAKIAKQQRPLRNLLFFCIRCWEAANICSKKLLFPINRGSRYCEGNQLVARIRLRPSLFPQHRLGHRTGTANAAQ